jgi:hypothetical protein
MEFVVISTVIKTIVDAFKRKFEFSGTTTNLVALALGIGLAFLGQLDYSNAFDVSFGTEWLGYLTTGVGLAGFSAGIHEAVTARKPSPALEDAGFEDAEPDHTP